MATEVLATIASSGGDYTSLSACEAGEQQDYRNNGLSGLWQYIEDFDDTVKASIGGSNTGPDNRIVVNCAPGIGHVGVADATKQRLFISGQSGNAIYCSQRDVTFEGLQIIIDSPTSSTTGFDTYRPDAVVLRRVLIQGARTYNYRYSVDAYFTADYHLLTMENCTFTNAYDTAVRAQVYATAPRYPTLTIRNCTIESYSASAWAHVVAISTGSPENTFLTLDMTNTILIQGYRYGASLTIGGSNDVLDYMIFSGSRNITSDGQAALFGGTNYPNRSVTDSAEPGAGDWLVVFNDTDYADMRLQDVAENDAVENGIDLSAYFTDDIEGQTRTQWDIGSDGIYFEIPATATVDMALVAVGAADPLVLVQARRREYVRATLSLDTIAADTVALQTTVSGELAAQTVESQTLDLE